MEGRIQFDEFRKAAVDRGREWKFPEDTIELKAWFEKTWISGEVKTATVNEAIAAVASRHKVHPIRDWLEGLEWDRIERLPTFFLIFAGETDPIHRCGWKVAVRFGSGAHHAAWLPSRYHGDP